MCCAREFWTRIGLRSVFMCYLMILKAASDKPPTIDQLLQIQCHHPKSYICLPYGICCSGGEFCFQGQCHDCFPKEVKEDLLSWCREHGLHNVSLMGHPSCGLACQARFNVSQLNDFSEYQKNISGLSLEISACQQSKDSELKKLSECQKSNEEEIKEKVTWKGAFIGCVILIPLVTTIVLFCVYTCYDNKIPFFHAAFWRNCLHCKRCVPEDSKQEQRRNGNAGLVQHVIGTNAAQVGQNPNQLSPDQEQNEFNVVGRTVAQIEHPHIKEVIEHTPLISHDAHTGQNEDIDGQPDLNNSDDEPPVNRSGQSSVERRLNQA
ncbi:hypothetical protein Btru_027853 [Bulinus truncatus]|nr:hypothetical protein Btru_027853 [Bulinus truncatus]